MPLRFHFPKIVELITKTVRGLRPLLYDSKNETVFIFHVVVLLYRIVTLEINFRNQSIEEYSSNTNTSYSIVFSLTQASWFCSVVFDSFRYPKNEEKLTPQGGSVVNRNSSLIWTIRIRVCNLTEFFIGKYNDLNIVWFWRFITSLQTYHTMKTKLVEQSPKFKVLNAI